MTHRSPPPSHYNPPPMFGLRIVDVSQVVWTGRGLHLTFDQQAIAMRVLDEAIKKWICAAFGVPEHILLNLRQEVE